MPTLSLPIVSCDGCGACCTHIGTPPGAFPVFASGEEIRPGYFAEWGGLDYEIWLSMPPDLRQELTAYYVAALREKSIPERRDGVDHCLWYDPATRQCKHYEFRPETCREFEVGCKACLKHRRRAGIDPEATAG